MRKDFCSTNAKYYVSASERSPGESASPEFSFQQKLQEGLSGIV